MSDIVLFDTETTGLIKNTRLSLDLQPKVIEFYGVRVNGETWEEVDEVEFLANPGFKLEEIITNITGLKDSDLVNEPPFSANAHKVVALFEGASEAVAHNLAYDRNMLAFEFQRANLALPWPIRMTCTVAGTEHIKGHRLNLSTLHEHLFGERFEGAHRAREDVHALLRCFKELRQKGEI